MRAAYIDPVSGVSGDMLLGALIDAGAALDDVRAALAPLTTAGLTGWSLDVQETQRAGLRAARVVVTIADAPRPRTVREVLALLDAPGLHPRDREQARAVFTLLGDVEAAVHGVPADGTQHLHEVGAMDAIVDVVGTVAALRLLGVEALYAGPLPLGGGVVGTVDSPHGTLPMPAPAVLEIAARARIPLAAPVAGEPAFELVTPTGAAILGALARFARPALTLDRIGVGAGSRDLAGWPNVTRVWCGYTVGDVGEGAISVRPLVVVQTDIDDTPPEHIPFLETRLREAGALDVWWTPVQMKKGRPGIEVTAVADPNAEQAVVTAMLRHSSTLGVRVSTVRRYEAEREGLAFTSSLGPVAVKVKRLPGAAPVVAPEYEACRMLAERHALPIADVYRIVTAEALERLHSA